MENSPRRSLADLKPEVLESWRITLHPMEESDAEELMEVTRDERLWRYMVRGPFISADDARAFIRQALEAQARGTDIAFVARRKSDHRMIGSARYLVIDPTHGSVEVGWLFLDTRAHGHFFVQELCYLMIAHAFERGADRVWLKTDDRNVAAKKAMDSMGLQHEGVLRSHMRVRNGFLRDSSVHSYISSEWGECGPKFRERVLSMLEKDAQSNARRTANEGR